MRWLPTKREMLPVLGTELVVWESWKGQDNHGLDLWKIATKILSLLVFLWVSQSRVKVGSYILYHFIVNVPVLHHCDPLCIKVPVCLLVKPNVYWSETNLRMRLDWVSEYTCWPHHRVLEKDLAHESGQHCAGGSSLSCCQVWMHLDSETHCLLPSARSCPTKQLCPMWLQGPQHKEQ